MKYCAAATGVLLSLITACGGASVTPSRGGNGANSGSNINPATGLIGTSSAGSGSVGRTNRDPNVCATASVAATRVTPAVYFVVDGSSSMDERFGNGTRWSVLRDALVGAQGVVTQLESVVEFGMSIYSNSDPMKCPATTDVKPALQNLMPLSAAYPMAQPGGGTPTGEALQKVVDGLPDFNGLDHAGAPPIIILATDGEPNGCASAGACNWAADWANCLGQLGNQLAAAPATYDTTLAAVRAARAKNIAVWVISLADGLNTIPDLQKTANIGAGMPDAASPGATIYSPQNAADLTQTLANLLGGVVSCDVALAGMLNVDRACEGSVTMNGERLACNSEQGWKAVDQGHIALQGSACDRFKSDPSVLLDASFPCDVVVPQ